MHDSVYQFVKRWTERHPPEGKDVIEFGALDVNGSVRPLFKDAKSYLGTDLQAGPGVDLVEACENIRGTCALDIAISTEMLEHAADWRGAITSMKNAVKAGGWVILTARGPNFGRHGYPGDYWRFTVELVKEIFADFDIETCEDDYYPGFGFLFAGQKTERPAVDLSKINAIDLKDIENGLYQA